MDPIDDLLSTLEPSNPTSKIPPSRPPQALSPSVTASDSTAPASIDQLLARLSTPQTQQVRDTLTRFHSAPLAPVENSEIIAYATQQAQQQQVQQQLEQAEAQQQQAQKQQRLQALKQQRQQELRSQAQQWLDQLDVKSTEGRWFDEFRCNYDSQLEAAIAYITALQEVDHWLISRQQNLDEDG